MQGLLKERRHTGHSRQTHMQISKALPEFLHSTLEALTSLRFRTFFHNPAQISSASVFCVRQKTASHHLPFLILETWHKEQARWWYMHQDEGWFPYLCCSAFLIDASDQYQSPTPHQVLGSPSPPSFSPLNRCNKAGESLQLAILYHRSKIKAEEYTATIKLTAFSILQCFQ